MEIQVWKLFRERRDGTLGSLFINRRMVVPIGEWIEAGCYPTKGYAVREGWHCTERPVAPHLKLSNDRVWRKVLIREYEELMRPHSQGGLWYIAKEMKVL